ncbi:hypothetical protein, partial [Sphingomonas sp. CCH10-B3]|uniref:hypothetical protein n=1 Tax=Sphingomonas sp. CCH10-B3 TaxID=1768757 RepID=UPI003FA6F000
PPPAAPQLPFAVCPCPHCRALARRYPNDGEQLHLPPPIKPPAVTEKSIAKPKSSRKMGAPTVAGAPSSPGPQSKAPPLPSGDAGSQRHPDRNRRSRPNSPAGERS